MIRISNSTRLKPAEILDRAAKFFGPDGLGLQETERGDCCISFGGTDGYISVRLVEESGRRAVDVESREYEYHAKQFLKRL
jgi:hypothetical protein